MSGMFLNGGQERPLCEDVNVKPGLLWRPQDVGDARVVGYLPRKDANGELNIPKKKKYVVVNKAEQNWRTEECFDIEHGDEIFRVFQACFPPCFGTVFPHYAPFLPFWNGNAYHAPFYVGSIKCPLSF